MSLQELFNVALTVVLGVFSWLGKTIWGDVQDQKHELATLREQIATERVHKDDLRQMTDAIFRKLDRIEDKLDTKADR